MNSALTFAHPGVFWAMFALPVLAAIFLSAEHARRTALSLLLAARLQPRLAGSVSTARRRAGFALLLAGLALCITALARPQWGVTLEEQTTRGRDIIFAIDTSRSMLAQDVPPNRLERAKFAALDLMGEIGGDRVGLIAFAGEAFLQAPLTPDHDAVAENIQSLDTENIGQGGSNLAAAIAAARDAFGKGESTQRALILFSDGEELQEDVLKAAEDCKALFRIYTIGVGTEGGAPVIRPTQYGGEYVRDASGNIVSSKLDESRLREVAKITGGFYLRLQNGPVDMHHLAQMGLETMSEKDSETRTKEVPKERFQWPLTAGLVFLATAILLGERRRMMRTATATAAAALLLFTPPLHAADGLRGQLNHLFDSEAPAVDSGDLSKELKKVEDQKSRRPGVPEIDYNLGCTAYSAGDYDRAVSSFSNTLGAAKPELRAQATYNLANSLARRGVKRDKDAKLSDWNNAVKQYDATLALDPANAKARENRDAVLKAIEALKKEEEQKQQQQQQQKSQDKDGQKKDQNKQDNNQNQSQQQNKDQQKDPQNKDQQKQDGQDSKDQQSQQDQSQEKKDQGKKDQQSQQQKEGNEPKPDEAKPGEQQDQNAQQQDGKDAGKPKDGNLQPAGKPGDKPSGAGGKPGEDKAEEEAEALQAAKEGRMTEKDARALIDSARKYEQVIPPLQQLMERRRARPNNGKDW